MFSQIFGPQPTFVSDHTEEIAGFLQATLTPIENLIFVAGGRFDHFNQFGGVWTYRVAGSYKIDQTNTTLHSSVATGFSPPSSQDKIFGNNFGFKPGTRFRLGHRRQAGALEEPRCARPDLFSQRFVERDRIQRTFSDAQPRRSRDAGTRSGIARATDCQSSVHGELHLSGRGKNSSADISQPKGARLPRRPRNEVYVSASYLWWKRLRTTVEAKFVNAREELNFGGPNFDIEDYSFVNFAAEYEVNPHLSIFGRIDNLSERALLGGVRFSRARPRRVWRE